jgi:hypothetical protein
MRLKTEHLPDPGVGGGGCHAQLLVMWSAYTRAVIKGEVPDPSNSPRAATSMPTPGIRSAMHGPGVKPYAAIGKWFCEYSVVDHLG